MDPGLLIALLNPSIALVLAAAFIVLWLYQRSRRYLAVLSAGYAASAAGFLLQYFPLPAADVNKLLSNGFFIAAASCVAGAIVARSGRKVPLVAIGTVAAGGLAAFCWLLFAVPELTWRTYAVNFALGGILLIAAVELRHGRRNGPTDMILLVLCVLGALNFTVRTMLVIGVHGAFLSQDDFYRSTYWNTSLLSHAVLSLLVALTLFMDAALDMMGRLRTDARTDPLSRLLNRRGFEERAALLLDHCSRAGMPLALVMADLDHFKSINDMYGHAAGDRVIAHFAACLQAAAGSSGVVGRLGGEEFGAVVAPADLATARLMVEAVRSRFSAGTVTGIPPGVRVTASFGVASRAGGEGLDPLMRRADEALYKAKQNGRDSVRISYERPQMPADARAAG